MDDLDRAKKNQDTFNAADLDAALNTPHEWPLVVHGTVYCLDCRHEIPAARLQALPSAVRCAACQTKKDGA